MSAYAIAKEQLAAARKAASENDVDEELLLRAQRILERTRPGGPDQKQFLAGHTSHLALTDLIQLLSGNQRIPTAMGTTICSWCRRGPRRCTRCATTAAASRTPAAHQRS